jgi:putative FmdB family regulatory protein
MPTYEYECTDCRYRFDELQKLTEPPLLTCPKCKGRLRRLVSAGGGFIFKGSGFYETDYKRKSKEETRSAKKAKTEEKKPAE